MDIFYYDFVLIQIKANPFFVSFLTFHMHNIYFSRCWDHRLAISKIYCGVLVGWLSYNFTYHTYKKPISATDLLAGWWPMIAECRSLTERHTPRIHRIKPPIRHCSLSLFICDGFWLSWVWWIGHVLFARGLFVARQIADKCSRLRLFFLLMRFMLLSGCCDNGQCRANQIEIESDCSRAAQQVPPRHLTCGSIRADFLIFLRPVHIIYFNN